MNDAENKAKEVVVLAESQATALQEAAVRRRAAEEALSVGHFNTTRQLLAQELHALHDEAREEAAQAEKQRWAKAELAVAHFNTTRQLLRNELRILKEETEAQREADEEASAAAQLHTQQQAEKDATDKVRSAEEEAANKLQDAEDKAAEILRQAEEKASSLVDRSSKSASSPIMATEPSASTGAEEARAFAALAAAEVNKARAAQAAAEAAQRAMEAEIAQKLAVQEARLRDQHTRELRRRTGALAEQHASAMADVNEAHADAMREQLRQLRLAAASREGSTGQVAPSTRER